MARLRLVARTELKSRTKSDVVSADEGRQRRRRRQGGGWRHDGDGVRRLSARIRFVRVMSRRDHVQVALEFDRVGDRGDDLKLPSELLSRPSSRISHSTNAFLDRGHLKKNSNTIYGLLFYNSEFHNTRTGCES